ncbi:hypothetical protein BGZ61DRAFT_458235 [Ilyonectria robusta]|uniref:uncharacterized protein n=1 Tax=Ilyonectria robusta TaxID=1079257 RepID=UPI001E8D8045|nr:uncharacterized protein BGZ61DRAFT_458235 [Ilyonectria robusta]KAH8675058.1 hypothetical protein BGZ61DRAFT_458235 [Ilyonectria robusta]
MLSTNLLTLLATAALAISGVASSPCRSLPILESTCSEVQIKKRMTLQRDQVCSGTYRLTNPAFRIDRQKGLTWNECGAWCNDTNGCTMITFDHDNYCAIWRGTHAEAGMSAASLDGEYLSDLSCFTCRTIRNTEEIRRTF